MLNIIKHLQNSIYQMIEGMRLPFPVSLLAASFLCAWDFAAYDITFRCPRKYVS